ncbi:MAG TPA: hypothetical protein VEM76_01115 [Anaeromyxobacteraceae bacterium]|nr:hypothetical protein [Anaeromyxobacteraceae bacterium]
MGLYLCVFREDEELVGVDVGSYDDFERFRDAARARDRRLFRRYGALRVNMSPTTHWSPREAARLAGELVHLREALRQAPAQPFPSGSWQAARAAELGLAPTSLAECFFDFDGGPLFDRLLELCRVAVEAREPILFQ